MSTREVARPRAFWTDARFILGIVLIAASVAGVWLVVAGSRQTAPVLVASRTIVVGDELAAADLRVVEVALTALGDTYAVPGSLEPGAVATRTIPEGELIPTSAVGGPDAVRTTTIVVSSATAVPAAVEPGSAVELWSAPQTERGVFDEPRVLVPEATVAAVREADTVMGQAAASLEIVVDRADVAAALGAIADGDALSIVPTGAR